MMQKHILVMPRQVIVMQRQYYKKNYNYNNIFNIVYVTYTIFNI